MNKAFKVIWNEVTATFVAVPESAKGHGAPGGERLLERIAQVRRSAQLFFIKPLVAALICIGFTFATYAAPLTPNVSAPSATQLPTGAQVSAGAAQVTQAGTVLSVKQSSSNAAVNWQSFDVGSQATVNFEQPNAQSVILNRVQSSNPSQIFGKINANGSVFLQNPNGVYFAPGSSVDVGSFLATTHHISDEDLMSGNYTFGRTGSTGRILNQGSITSKLGGYIALLAPEVRNEGVVVARGGTIVLAAGETFQLQFEANHALTNVLVSPSTVAAYVENGNAVMAPGGLVILSAQAANAIQGGVVKNTGTIQANGLVNDGGVIKLVASHGVSNSGTITADALPSGTGSGGQILLMSDLQVPESTTQVDGTLSAQAGNSGGDGGRIETSGSHVHVAPATHITTHAPQGTGGSWIIDPTDFTVGSAVGNDMTGATLGANLNANNVTILSSSGGTGTSGNVNINEAVSWNGAKKLTLSASNNININNAINVPTGGSVSLVYGTGDATGNYNFGSFGLNNTAFTGAINFAGTGAGLFTTQLGANAVDSYTVITNPSTYVLSTNPTGGINSVSGKFALGQNYNFDRSFTASPITGTFSGKFEGLGHTVSNLTGTGAIGLFSNSSGLIRDVGVNMSTNSAATGTGGLVNTNSGTILNSFANASINSVVNANGYASYGTLGGLVGTNSGPISNSFSTGSINGASVLGGLIGINASSSNLLPSDILNSFSTASVTSGGGGGAFGGGLIGENKTSGVGGSAKITNSFATGNVTGFVNAGTGGLVGYNHTGANNSFVSISNSYATGTIFGPTFNGAQNYVFGGLVGLNQAQGTGSDASISNSYATGDVNAAASGVGGLVGTNRALSPSSSTSVTGSYATGAVNTYSNGTTNGNSQSIGGLIGGNSASGANATSTVTQSYARGSVNGAAGTGGLIGNNNATAAGDTSVSLSNATGNVKSNNSNAGGLIGSNTTAGNSLASKSTVSSSYATGNVSVVDGLTAVQSSSTGTWGGLIGNNVAINSTLGDISVSNSYALGNVSGVAGSLGGLIGNNQATGKATVTNSYATGNVASSGAGTVGGLIGQNISNLPADSSTSGNLNISTSYATGNVSGTTQIGGLIGYITITGTNGVANVSTSYANGNVTGTSSNVGGLVGKIDVSSVGSSATISNSYSANPTSAITVQGTSNVGGLVGYNYASANNANVSISDSYARASVTGTSSGVGGLVGSNLANANGSKATFTNDNAWGNVSGTSSVGGLLGSNIANFGGNANITTSYATGSVTGSNSNVGGLVGVNSANNSGTSSSTNITSSYATGNVTDTYTTFSYVGGLIGQNYSGGSGNTATVAQSYALGNVVASGIDVGGLIGYNVGNGNSTISQSYASGNVSSTSSTAYNFGGLVGYNLGGAAGSDVSVSLSYSNGSVSAPGNTAGGFGGFIGQVNPSTGAASIDKSYSTGSVQVSNTGSIYAGGFVGMVPTSSAGSSINITNSFSTGNVQGASGNYLGGFVGQFLSATRGSISSSYETGGVSGSTHLGGFIGAIGATTTLQNNFWNATNNAGLSLVSGGVGDKTVATSGISGLSTVQMQSFANFTSWDSNIWQTLSYFNNQLPFLKQNNTLASIALIAGSNNYGETPTLNYSITNSFGNAITTPVATGTPVWALSQGGNFIGNQSITSSTNAGTYSLTYASGIRLGNYTIMSGSATDWTVNKAPLGLSVTGTYSGTTSIAPTSYTVTGLKNGETMVPTQVTVSDANVATANKFVQAITANTGNANFANYSITSAYNAAPNSTSSNSVTLNPIALTVSGVASTSGNIYSGQAYTGTYTSSAMVAADANLIAVTGVATGTDAGTYPSNLSVTLSGSAQTNYSTPTIRNANFVISPKPIAVTSQAIAATYDGLTTYSTLAGQATYTYTDLVLGDTLGSVTQVANKTGIAQAGSYTVTPSLATLANGNPANYQFSYVSSNANVSPIALTVLNSSVASKVYDRTTQASVSNGSLQGVLAADTNNVTLNQSGAFASPNVGAAVAVNLADTLSGSASSNYTITQPTGLTAAITPKSLGVNGQTGVNKVFDASTVAAMSGGALTGVLAGDQVTLVQTGAFASANVGTAKPITPANALTGDQAGNYQVTQPSYALTANITPAVLNVQGLAASPKVYDGTTTAVLSGNAVAQPLGGGQVTINGTPVGSYANKNVGTNKFIDVTGFTLSGADAPNYQVTGLHGVYGDITPASLSVSSAVANNKVYDATTAATLSGAVLNGLIAGDVVNVNTGTFNNKTVGTGKAVTALLTGADAGNYNATGLTGYSANITPASLTVSGQTAANKVYDATTTAVLSGGSLSGVFAGDTVSLNQAGSFNTKNVGIAKPITPSNTLSGAEASNYLLTQPTLSANITPATLVVSGLTAADKVYNALTDASITGQPTVNALAGDVVTFSGTASGTFADKNVGVGKAVLISGLSIDAGAADGANYVLSTDIGLTANITKRDLTVTGSSVATKVYDRSTTATITGGVLQGLQGGESLTLSQTGSFVDKNAGVGKAVTANQSIADAGTSRASNYNLIQPTGLTGTITPAPLSVTGLSVSDKFYDGTTDATVAGNVVANPLAGDDVSISGVPSAQFSSKNAGNNIPVAISNLALSGADAANYSASGITGVVATIKPAPLTAEVADFSKVYDGTTNASPRLVITSGLIGNETVSATGSGFLDNKNVLDATALRVTSTTLIDGNNGGLASNYVLQPGQNGNATVTPKALTASVAAPQKVYDGTALFTPTVTITSGLVGTETLGVTGAATFNSKDVATSNTLTLQAINLSDGNNGGLASNYSLDLGQNMAAKILPAPLTASLTASSKVYDGTTAATSTMRITSGLIGEETVTVNGLAAFNSKDVAAANVVTVNQATLLDGANGGLASNYKLDPGQSVAARITPAPLTASVSSANKVYNGTTAATASLSIVSGLIGSEGLNVTGNVNFNSKDVASANQLTVQSINLADGANGGVASNYSLDPGQSVASKITPAPLTASVSVPEKFYDGSVSANPSMNVLSGLIGSEKVIITAKASFNSKDVDSASKVTVNSVSLSDGSNGGLGSNYSLSAGQTVAAKITPAVLTASVSAPNKVYDGAPSANASLNITAGLVGSETLVATGKGTFNTKDVATANLLTVQSVSLEDGNNGGRAVNYSLSPGQTVAAKISPASLSVAQIASSSSTYAEPIKTGEVTLIGVIGVDKVTGVVELADVMYSSSKNVAVGSYKQAVNSLSGADASNYKVRPVTSMAANYVVNPLSLSGSIASSSSTSGASLVPGAVSLSNVIANDTIGSAEVAVVIPGDPIGSKTGNTVGNFAGSQKIASLAGPDAANYNYTQVVGNYQVKTGFSSGAIYPREMNASAVKPVVNKDSSLAKVSEPISNERVMAQDSKTARADQSTTSQATQDVRTAPTQAKSDDAAKVLTQPDQKTLQVATLSKADAKVTSQLRASSPNRSPSLVQPSGLASGFAPGLAPGASPGASPGVSPGLSSNSPSTGLPSGENTSSVDQGSSLSENTQSQKTDAESNFVQDPYEPIYSAIREVLESEVTYQVVGGVTSVVVVANALLTAASKLGIANLAGGLPGHVPLNVPAPSSSLINNRFGPRLTARI